MILKVTLKVHSLGTLTLDRRFEQRPGGLREALTIYSKDMIVVHVFALSLCSTSSPGGNQVDGLPPV